MSCRPCFLAQSDLAPGERELMPAAAGSLANDSLRRWFAAQEKRNFIEIQKTEKIQRNAQHKRLAPRSGPGEVLARRGRLTKLPEVSAKEHREVQWQR